MAVYEMKNCKLLGGMETKQALNLFLSHCSFKGVGFAVFFPSFCFLDFSINAEEQLKCNFMCSLVGL